MKNRNLKKPGVPWLLVSRAILLIVGLSILAMSIPHQKVLERRSDNSKKYINFQDRSIILGLPIVVVPQDNTSVSSKGISIRIILPIILLLLLAVIVLSPWCRLALANLLGNKRALLAILACFFAFLLTLLPVKGRFDGLISLLFLALRSIGTILLFFGAYPFIRIFYRKFPVLVRFLVRRARELASLFLNMNGRQFVFIMFFLTFAITNLCSYFVFHHIPQLVDSADQLFHGKIFALGKMTVPSHEYKEFFDFPHMINNGKWYSQYPPTHTFFLMLGSIMHMPWIINPLMGSLSIVLFYLIGRDIYDEKTGRLAALLGIVSPFIIITSSEFMNHGSALLFTCLFILFFIKAIKRRTWYYPLLSGLSLGIALNSRPLTTIAIALPFAIYSFFLLGKAFKIYIPSFFLMLLPFAVLIGVLLLFNYLTNGDPFLFGYEVCHGKGHNLGFGHSGWGPPHTPKRGLLQTINNFNALNKFLFEWPLPSLFFACLLFASMTRNKWDYILLSSAISLSFAYFFYWFQGWGFGPRFLYSSLFMIVLLTARGILMVPRLVNNILKLDVSEKRIKTVMAVLVLFCVITTISFQVPGFMKAYSGGEDVNAMFEAVKKENIKNAVIFVRSSLTAVIMGNSPLLDADIIYARDMGKKNILLMKYYPERKYYIATGGDIQEIQKVESDGARLSGLLYGYRGMVPYTSLTGCGLSFQRL